MSETSFRSVRQPSNGPASTRRIPVAQGRLSVDPAARQLFEALYAWRARTAPDGLVTWTSNTSLVACSASSAPATDLGEGPCVTVLSRCEIPADTMTANGAGDVIVRLGAIHPGFVRVGPGAETFVDFVSDQLVLREEPSGRILETAAVLFGAEVIDLPGRILSAWRLAPSGGPAAVELVDLEGYDPEQPWLLDSRFPARSFVSFGDRPEFLPVFEDAVRRRQPPAGDLVLAGGLTVDAVVRSIVRDAVRHWLDGEGELPPDPFVRGGHRSFIDWLNSPDPASFGTASRYFWSLHQSRSDLQAAFALPNEEEARRFSEWIALVWHPEHRSLLLRPLPPPDRQAPLSEDLRPGGVNVIGYLDRDVSLGHIARQLVSSLRTVGIPTAGLAYQRNHSPLLAETPSLDPTIPYTTSIAVVNADQFDFLAADLPPVAFANRYTIGYWFWELEHIPPNMRRATRHVDEIWVGSEFVRDAFQAVTVKPVRALPPRLEMPKPSSRDRNSFGIGEDRFVFLCTFDFFSIVERKNPFGLVEAFSRAFAERRDVELIIKTTNGRRRPSQFERLRVATNGLANVRVIDDYFSRADQMALLREIDALVSLHRSEGLGLHFAEAMALGTPVIATRYSGNLDFMDDDNSYLVDATRVPIQYGEGIYPASATWAAPDLDQAADIMRHVAGRPTELVARIEAAKRTAEVLAGDGPAGRIRDRLDEIWHGERSDNER